MPCRSSGPAGNIRCLKQLEQLWTKQHAASILTLPFQKWTFANSKLQHGAYPTSKTFMANSRVSCASASWEYKSVVRPVFPSFHSFMAKAKRQSHNMFHKWTMKIWYSLLTLIRRRWSPKQDEPTLPSDANSQAQFQKVKGHFAVITPSSVIAEAAGEKKQKKALSSAQLSRGSPQSSWNPTWLKTSCWRLGDVLRNHYGGDTCWNLRALLTL